MPVEIIQPQEGYVRILGVGEPVVPTETTFTVEGGTKGTQPTFTGAPLFTGSYIRQGSLVHFRFDVDFDNILTFGTGQYYLNLPFIPKHNYQFADGCLHDLSTGRNYPIMGHVFAGSNEMLLESMDAQGNTVFNVDFTFNSPVTLNVADNFHISGQFIIEEES
jgi:hypothetical protein